MKRILYCILPFCMFAPLAAQAYEGYVVADISLQAGPDTEYPSITELYAGTPVDIQGCIDGYSWCDVITGEDRGWVPGTFVQEEYDNQRVYIADYGPRIGIPIVAFSLGLYWDQHYRNRNWYGQRSQWESRHFTYRAPARPASVHYTPRESGPRQGGSQSTVRQGQAPARQAPMQEARPAMTTTQQQPRTNTRELQRTQSQPTRVAPVAQEAQQSAPERKVEQRTVHQAPQHTPAIAVAVATGSRATTGCTTAARCAQAQGRTEGEVGEAGKREEGRPRR